MQNPGFEGLLTFEEFQHGVVGIDGIGIDDGFEEFVVCCLGIGVAVVSLVGGGSGVAGDDASTECTVVSSEGELDVSEGRGEELGDLKIDGGAFDSAEGISARLVGTHDGRIRPVPIFAHLTGESLKNGKVGLVGGDGTHPFGELVLVEIDFERLPFGIEGFFLIGE